MKQIVRYDEDPADKAAFTARFDRFYTRFALIYDVTVKLLPVWKGWLQHALSHMQGPRVLEVSFGTGYLLAQYADRFETYGIDYNPRMVALARQNLARHGLQATLQQGDVATLPYADAVFDSVVNTMAFSGYPDGRQALAEMGRVLKPDGRLILIDINYPHDRNWLGMKLVAFWAAAGDLIRDMATLFDAYDFTYTEQEIGGFGGTWSDEMSHIWEAISPHLNDRNTLNTLTVRPLWHFGRLHVFWKSPIMSVYFCWPRTPRVISHKGKKNA